MHPGANSKEVVDAFERMMANEGSKQHLISKLGDYPMYLGDDSNIIMESLYSYVTCLLYTSPSPRDRTRSRMPSSA